MIAVLVGVLAFIVGWFARGVQWRTPGRPRRTEPYQHDEYLQRYNQVSAAYTASIKEYDRLVTWVSGGALGLSVAFVERLGPVPPETAPLLAWGWGALGAALLMSLYSQYFSSRTHSWRIRELSHLQVEDAKRPPEWAATAVRFDGRATFYGWATKLLTFFSGGVLVGGLMLLAVFAFRNVTATRPTIDGGGSGGPVTRTQELVVPERRGVDDLPEPLPRPVAPAAITPTPDPIPTPTPAQSKTPAAPAAQN